MASYVKLFGSILDSTVWETPPAIKVVWITLLAMADRDGVVEASVPGLAKRAGVERGECEKAIALFLAPDPDSRTKEHEGRRIAVVDGGWRLLNYDKYRERASAEEAREKNAARQQRFRERKAAARNAKVTPVTAVDESNDIASPSGSGSGSPATEASPPPPPPPAAPVPVPVRVLAVPDAWGLGAWEALWMSTLKCRPADRHKDGRDRWRDLVERIAVDAGLLEPPMDPAAYAEVLMRALPAYAEHAGRTGEEVPSVSVAAFEGWYPKLAAWVAARRPKGKRATAGEGAAGGGGPVRAPEPQRVMTPEEEAAEAAAARDALDQLFKRGKYAPTANGARVQTGATEEPPKF